MWCPNIMQMKAHKACILWSLLILSSIPYKKNMHNNKNDDFFSIIYSCPISCCIISTSYYHRTLTGMAAKKTYSFFGKMAYRFWRSYDETFLMKVCKKESKRQIKCIYYSLKLSNFLLCNTSLLTCFNWKGR